MNSIAAKKYYYCYTCPKLIDDLHSHILTGHEAIEAEVTWVDSVMKLRFRVYTLLMFYKNNTTILTAILPQFELYGEYIYQEDFLEIVRSSELTTLPAIQRLEILCNAITELIFKAEAVRKTREELNDFEKEVKTEKREQKLADLRRRTKKWREKVKKREEERKAKELWDKGNNEGNF
jgi:hypothetical protein